MIIRRTPAPDAYVDVDRNTSEPQTSTICRLHSQRYKYLVSIPIHFIIYALGTVSPRERQSGLAVLLHIDRSSKRDLYHA
jgi:hypothetical protein